MGYRKKDLALLMYTKEDRDFGHVILNFIEVKDRKPRNPSHSFDDNPNQLCDNLTLSNQISVNAESYPCTSYGWGYSYRDVFSV